MATIFPSIWLTEVISFLSESKGSSAKRGYWLFKSSCSMPFLWAATKMEVSVGSPMCCSVPSSL